MHKKYIKIKGKTYGPYYYESYREGGKIKKRYVKISPHKRRVNDNILISSHFVILYFMLIGILLIFTISRYTGIDIFERVLPFELLFAPPGASFGSNGNANLTIYDDTDEPDIDRYSYCDEYCAQKNKPSSVLWNIFFFANYTDVSGNVIDDSNGLCSVRYDFGSGYGTYENMNYSASSLLWSSNRSFLYKGTHKFEALCTSSFGNVLLENSFIVTNTAPYIIKTASGFIDFNGDGVKDTLSCIEDQLCTYNFSANVSDDDLNDVLNYGYFASSNTTLTNFSINANTGILEVNVTNNDNTGLKKIELNVHDTESPTTSALLEVNIAAVNDPPLFVNLENKSFNMSQLFRYNIAAIDEENNIPFSFNITFLSCATAEWSNRGNVNCTLFNSTHYSVNDTAINISFIPTRNDVGSYIINFSATDSGIPNATTSQIVNFSVLNINSPPLFDYVCDNERNTTEDNVFSCYINATDIDEVNNLTFSSNVSWFLGSQTVSVNSSTNFKGFVLVGFTPSDINVGNWSINASVRDTGSPTMINSTEFYFFVDNINDSVFLDDINDITAFTSNNYSIHVNASDDDLLIPDKNIYREIIDFSSNLSWVNVSVYNVISNSNLTVGVIKFNPNDGGVGVHGVNITVRDVNNYSIDSDVFFITILGNDPPIWNPSTQTTQILIEDMPFYLNLSENVSDPDGDSINFSFASDTSFPSFSLNLTTGIIDFIPRDEDVGQHMLIINASDGKTPVPLTFNFSVYNINDAPLIERPLTGNGVTIDISNSNMNTTEDSNVDIFLFIQDNDFSIPSNQKSFYNEILSVSTIIQGRNNSLFSFSQVSFIAPNKTIFQATFTPRKLDVGIYNITINVTDANGDFNIMEFNLTIKAINHAPVLNNLTNQSSAINRNFYYDINASDIEDGYDNGGNLTFSYQFLFGDNLFNETNFNRTNGIINMTFNNSQAGRYNINISVNDSEGLMDSKDFWLFVYGLPSISSPDLGFVFNLTENNQSNLSFSASHLIEDNLTYEFFVNDRAKFNTTFYGNGTNISWQFIPDFIDETYGDFGNLTLIVSNPIYRELNVSGTWNANISHANAPIIFSGFIGDKQATFNQPIIINLSLYFSDIDHFDEHYNQSLNFSINSNTSVSMINHQISSDLILTLSASGIAKEILNISGSDFEGNVRLTNATSNNFEIVFLEPPTQVVETPRSTSTEIQEKPVLLKLILPGPVAAKKGDVITLPIGLVNEGNVLLKDINLTSLLALDGVIKEDAKVYFSKDFISELRPKESENLTLTIETGTIKLGLYEITINATVRTPKYVDWGKIYINIEEGETIVERLVFTEEFIAENPECAEITELVDESKRYVDIGDLIRAENKLEEAINACKLTISQQSFFSKGRLRIKFQDKIFIYLLITTILAIVLGIGYYVYRKAVIKRAAAEAQDINLGGK